MFWFWHRELVFLWQGRKQAGKLFKELTVHFKKRVNGFEFDFKVDVLEDLLQ